jgi:hypothetical protein
MSDHGCTCPVEKAANYRIALTVAVIPDMNLTAWINGQVNGLACATCVY